jgi:hypothetical protein
LCLFAQQTTAKRHAGHATRRLRPAESPELLALGGRLQEAVAAYRAALARKAQAFAEYDRTGTVRDACSAAREAREAAISILLELPIERVDDEALLLDVLFRSDWCMPFHLRKRTARRMARFVSSRILGEPFQRPIEAGPQ